MRTVIDFCKERLIMLMPGIFANDLMDGFFDAPERNYKKSYYNSGLMKTDIKENKDGFEVIMDLPGFKKEDIKMIKHLRMIQADIYAERDFILHAAETFM